MHPILQVKECVADDIGLPPISQWLVSNLQPVPAHQSRPMSAWAHSLHQAAYPDGELIGRSATMQTAFKRVALVAPTEACVVEICAYNYRMQLM
jgi:DNA-binding NtrC family response regulator